MSQTTNRKLLPTTVVGSYEQPNWLIDREALAAGSPPRARRKGLWRVDEEWLQEAQDDATIVAIRDQERAGIDIVTDGEMRRESYSNRFAAQYPAHGLPCERFASALASCRASLGAGAAG